jgi:hypothetical protein
MSSRTRRFARFHAILTSSTTGEKTRASGWREKNHVDTNLTNVSRVNRLRVEGERGRQPRPNPRSLEFFESQWKMRCRFATTLQYARLSLITYQCLFISLSMKGNLSLNNGKSSFRAFLLFLNFSELNTPVNPTGGPVQLQIHRRSIISILMV